MSLHIYLRIGDTVVYLEAAAKYYEDHGWKVTFDMTNSSEPIGFTFTPRPE